MTYIMYIGLSNDKISHSDQKSRRTIILGRILKTSKSLLSRKKSLGITTLVKRPEEMFLFIFILLVDNINICTYTMKDAVEDASFINLKKSNIPMFNHYYRKVRMKHIHRYLHSTLCVST